MPSKPIRLITAGVLVGSFLACVSSAPADPEPPDAYPNTAPTFEKYRLPTSLPDEPAGTIRDRDRDRGAAYDRGSAYDRGQRQGYDRGAAYDRGTRTDRGQGQGRDRAYDRTRSLYRGTRSDRGRASDLGPRTEFGPGYTETDRGVGPGFERDRGVDPEPVDFDETPPYPYSGGLYGEGYYDDDWYNDYYDDWHNDYYDEFTQTPRKFNDFTRLGPYTYPYRGGTFNDNYLDDDWFDDYYEDPTEDYIESRGQSVDFADPPYSYTYMYPRAADTYADGYSDDDWYADYYGDFGGDYYDYDELPNRDAVRDYSDDFEDRYDDYFEAREEYNEQMLDEFDDWED